MKLIAKLKSGSLGARAARASMIGFLRLGGLQVLRLGSNLIMTRLLLPEAFGLMALVTALLGGFTMLSDVGLHNSVVREKDGETAHFLRAAWMMKILRGLLITGAVLLSAVALGVLGPRLFQEGTVYADPRLPWLIVISASVPFLTGLESVNKELQQRRLHVGRLALVDIVAQALVILSMVSFALVSPTVWALTAGMLVGPAAKTLASHWVYPGPRMRLVWDAEIMLRLWHFGKWLIGSSAFTFVSASGDRFILGAYLNATSFGIYAIARVWIDAAQQVLGMLINGVGFSAIGEVLRDRPAEVPRLFRKYQTAVDLVCVAAFCAVFFLGPQLIQWLYTAVYAEAGDKIRLLAFGLLVARFNTFGSLVINMGNSRAGMMVNGLKALGLCVALPLAYQQFGLTGALVAVGLSPLVSVPYALHLVRPLLGPQLMIDVAWAVAIPVAVWVWLLLG